MTASLRARRVAAAAGLPEGVVLERAPSVFNEVWFANDRVLRVSKSPASRRLAYEAFVAHQLSPACLYPPILDFGRSEFGEWMLLKRMPGDVLSHTWPTMTVEARREAIRQLVDCVRALHQMSPPRNSRGEIIVPPFLHGDTLECPYQLPASRVIELLGRARALPRVDVGLIDAAIRFVLDRNQVFTAAENTSLIHGDLHFGNVLWDGEQITALLDFEWVRGGPADLDLDVLLRVVADPEIHQAGKITGPALTPAQSRAMYADVPKWCREFYPEWFANPNLLARLELYGLSFDVRDLLTQTPRAAAADQSALHPINRIKALVENRNHLTWLEW